MQINTVCAVPKVGEVWGQFKEWLQRITVCGIIIVWYKQPELYCCF